MSAYARLISLPISIYLPLNLRASNNILQAKLFFFSKLSMAMILDAFMSKFSTFLADFVHEEVIMQLGVKDELQTLCRRMKRIQCLLKDAEKKKFDESLIELWLSELKDVMYDAEDIIDLCRIEGTQLLADQNPESKTSSVRCDFSSAFSCFTSIPLRHEIGNRIKDINERLKKIYEDRERYNLEKSTISKTPQITVVDSRQTSSMNDPFVVGREIEVAATCLVDRLLGEKVDEKFRLLAITGMGGIGKTTLAQRIFNHKKIKTFSNLASVWVCVSQTYSEIELLKQVIREAKGSYRDANTKSELQTLLRDSVAKLQNFFLVLDDVWRADVWVDLFRVPLYNSNGSVRILITTRDGNVAKEMQASYIHPVTHLSEEISWDMLRRRLFSEEEEELANGLKELGLKLVNRCKGLPLAIKAIASVLARKQRTRKVWENFLRNDVWYISKLPEELRGALYLSFEDLPSHLKQIFLYFSLFPEDAELSRCDFTRLWVAEGFITKQQDSLMEDLAEECFNELLDRNLLLPIDDDIGKCKMHDLIRYLAIVLSKEEASFGYLNVRNSTTSIKLRRLSVANYHGSNKIFNSVADQGALRTLLASNSHLLLNDERLRRLLHLRVLDISYTHIQVLPDSIGNLVHLRYLNLKNTYIRAIPESTLQLTNLQFLDISYCINLIQLPSGITRLHNLRLLDLFETPISFMPQGIEKLQQLSYLMGFVLTNNDSSSKLEVLNSLKKIKTLHINIKNMKRPQSETIFLKELPNLSTLTLEFSMDERSPSEEQEQAVEELFDKIIPPQSLEDFTISGFFGRRFPNWMVSSSLKIYVPNLTKLVLRKITSCTQLPSLGQLPGLRELVINDVDKVNKIGPEFFGNSDVNSTRFAFPKLEQLEILHCYELEEWSFDIQVEQNASPRLELLPSLQKLRVICCPLLKELPKCLKYSTLKVLEINLAGNLNSIDNLSAEIEELNIHTCRSLKKVCCAPTLKKLVVRHCDAFFIDWLDSSDDIVKYVLPEWLLKLLQQRGLQNDSNDDFYLQLQFASKDCFRGCLKGGSYWDLIQCIPHAFVDWPGGHYLRYSKQPYVYDTNF